MRSTFLMLVLSTAMVAQTPDQASLLYQAGQLRTAIKDDALTRAAEIATELDGTLQAQHRVWLIRDSADRVEEVLSWLPPDMEGFWVNQEPFVLNSQDSAAVLSGRPAQLYSLDRLMALNDGRLYRTLSDRTVRLVVASTRGTQFDPGSIPRVMPAQDVVYFYFLTAPVDLPSPDESIQGRPVWQASAKVDAGGSFHAGAPRAQRDDPNWIALARPDMLILTNRKDLLDEILERVANGSKTRALPAVLPEWAQTDRSSPFWGLRHYTSQSRPKSGERGCDAAELPQPDCAAIGVTMRLDPGLQHVEIRYLSERPPADHGVTTDNVRREFQSDEPQTGVWRLVSDVNQRGPWPVHFALIMLGFGVYQ